jgi:2'-5' RNA ligase
MLHLLKKKNGDAREEVHITVLFLGHLREEE